jgi:transposase-like protein
MKKLLLGIAAACLAGFTFAQDAIDEFASIWDKKYPKISKSWYENRANLSTYFKFLQELRKLTYTTNAIEGINSKLRKVTKTKSLFPTDERLFKMLYLAQNTFMKICR